MVWPVQMKSWTEMHNNRSVTKLSYWTNGIGIVLTGSKHIALSIVFPTRLISFAVSSDRPRSILSFTKLQLPTDAKK